MANNIYKKITILNESTVDKEKREILTNKLKIIDNTIELC